MGNVITNSQVGIKELSSALGWVDVRSFMDGQSGRPTYATWYSNQATTDIGLSIQAAYNSITTGTIKFPAGFYLTSLPFPTLKSGITIEGDGSGVPGATSIKYTGTGYLFGYTDLGSIKDINLKGLSLYLGTSGTGIIQIGNLADSYDANYWRDNFHFQDVYLIGDYSSGTYRTGTIGMLTKQIASSQFDNLRIHNFETCWIQDTHTENLYNKLDLNTYANGLDIRGQTVGADRSTFVQPAFHGPVGSAVNGFGIKVNAGGISMINALYEPFGPFSGSGNNLIWLGYYGIGFVDMKGSLSIGADATGSFDNTLRVDQMGGGYVFDGTQFTVTTAPGVTIAAPDVNSASIGRFINCSPQLKTVLDNTSSNIGRYYWIGPTGTVNDLGIDGNIIMQLQKVSSASSAGVGMIRLFNYDIGDGASLIGRADSYYFTNRDGSVNYIYLTPAADMKVMTGGRGIVLINAAGTVTKRVRLNDAGDGLIYETP